MKTRALKIYRIVLISLVNLILILGFIILYKAYYDRLPGSIILEIKKEQVLSYNLPVSGTIYLSDNAQETVETASVAVTKVDFSEEVTLVASHPQNYVIKTKLFGVIPFISIAQPTIIISSYIRLISLNTSLHI